MNNNNVQQTLINWVLPEYTLNQILKLNELI